VRSGRRACSGPGFTAAISNGDEIIITIEAPSGEQFHVFHDVNLASDSLTIAPNWQAATGDTEVFSTAVLNLENLTGTAPNFILPGPNCQGGVGNAGVRVSGACVANVIGDFTFTGLTLSFNVTNSPPGQTAFFGSVLAGAEGGFVLTAGGPAGLETNRNAIQMQLEPVPEPSTALLRTAGVVGVAAMRRKYMSTAQQPGRGRFIMHRPKIYRSPLVLSVFALIALGCAFRECHRLLCSSCHPFPHR